MNFEDIKYKAWNTELNKMCFVENLEFLPNDSGEKELYLVTVDTKEKKENLDWWQADKVILLPFTGFKDKNGTEIYEGDIVQSTEYETYIIEWDTKTASFKLTDENNKVATGRMIHERFIKNYKIIGNVWENPELLKE